MKIRDLSPGDWFLDDSAHICVLTSHDFDPCEWSWYFDFDDNKHFDVSKSEDVVSLGVGLQSLAQKTHRVRELAMADAAINMALRERLKEVWHEYARLNSEAEAERVHGKLEDIDKWAEAILKK